MRQPFGQRGPESFGTHLIAGQPDPLEPWQQKFLGIARFAAGPAPGSQRIRRQTFDGIFAVVTANLTVFVEHFTFINPPRPAIPGTNLTEIFTLGLQTHNPISPGILHCESTNGFAPDKTPPPMSFILSQRGVNPRSLHSLTPKVRLLFSLLVFR